MKLNTLVLIIIGIFPAFTLHSQSEIKIEKICGSGYGECIGTTRDKALSEAKRNAMQKSGIEEHLNVYTNLYRAESENNYEELFSQDIFSQVLGSVKNVEVLNESKTFVEGDQMRIDLCISCTVVKFTVERDPSFNIEVNGVQPFYEHGDFLSFKVKPTQNCWMYAFFMKGEDATIVFPNYKDSKYMLTSGVEHTFPKNVALQIKYNEKSKSINRLILVILKEDIPFMGNPTYREISEWIFSIPPDKRHVYSKSFEIHERRQD